ncbi:hypothetical protein QUW49_01220 [Lacrimispora saccharolytica]|nr:hypothetical protein [Lacrimispora saccharolytica]
MKKILSLILTLTMVVGLSVTAYAADGITSGGTDSANVTGTYKSEATIPVYSVDITWEGLSFTYNGAFEGNWNPETHKYEDGTVAGWAAGNGTITVTNHSNTAITATPTYSTEAGYESAGMNFSTSALQVATADNGVDGEAGSAVTGKITVIPTGSLPEGTKDATIGTITVTVR